MSCISQYSAEPPAPFGFCAQTRQGVLRTAESPEEVLGVTEGSSYEVVRAAYKQKVLAAHPDRGGSPAEFQRLQRAYMQLTQPASSADGEAPDRGGEADELGIHLPAERPLSDEQLREHRALVCLASAEPAPSGLTRRASFARRAAGESLVCAGQRRPSSACEGAA